MLLFVQILHEQIASNKEDFLHFDQRLGIFPALSKIFGWMLCMLHYTFCKFMNNV